MDSISIDFESLVECLNGRFRDSFSEMSRKAFRETDCRIIQKDLNNIIEWLKRWQMSLNVDKCIVMHIGSRNSNQTYIRMGNCYGDLWRQSGWRQERMGSKTSPPEFSVIFRDNTVERFVWKSRSTGKRRGSIKSE